MVSSSSPPNPTTHSCPCTCGSLEPFASSGRGHSSSVSPLDPAPISSPQRRFHLLSGLMTNGLAG